MKKIIFLFLIFITAFSFKTIGQCGFSIDLTKVDNGCNEINNGSLNVNVVGIPNITYLWENEQGDSISNLSSINSLLSGIYIIYVTNTITNCTQYKTALISSYYKTNTIISNPTCPTCEDGIAEFQFSVDTPRLNTFQWDDDYSQTTRKASDLKVDFYSVTLTDSLNCFTNKIINIEDCGKNIILDSIFVNTASCSICNDASILAYVSGGAGGYTYQWDDNANQTTFNAINLDRHQNYSLIVTDVLGCQKTFFVDSTDFCKKSIFPFVDYYNEPTCYDCTDGYINIGTYGNYPPFEYLWLHNSNTTDSLVNAVPGIYTLKITDTIGCSIDYEVDYRYCFDDLILNADFFNINNDYITNSSVAGNDIIDPLMFVSYVIAENAKNGIVSMNIDGSFTYTPFNSYSGADRFTYKVFTDCGFSEEIVADLNISNPDMVWPGDVDLNGIVENFDLLPMAVKFDSLGPLRSSSSEKYFGQFANNWGSTQINGTNLKHADCDGSGTLDSLDAIIIEKNYGVVHSKVPEIVGNIPLKIIGPDSVIIGDTIEFKIFLGDSIYNADNVYGLAYTFNIEKDTKLSYLNARFNDSWFTPNSNRLSLSKPFTNKGRIDIVQSRIDGSNASGGGEISSIIVVIEEHLEDDSYPFTPVNISNVKLINNYETPAYIKMQNDSIVISVKDTIINISNIKDIIYNVSPNPSKGKFLLHLKYKADYQIEIINTIGTVVYERSVKNKSKINLNLEIGNGLFFLKVKSKDLESIQKLIIH